MATKVVVLGGAGAVGSQAVRTLAEHGGFDEVVIADWNLARAQELATEIGRAGVTAAGVDVMDPDGVANLVRGSDIVLNCVGPFYRSVKTVLSTVLDLGINYVDVCDDVDVTNEILEWDARAKAAGVTALIGMGSSPGVTNLFAKFVVDQMLDECETVDIFHTHGGEPIEGPGVIGHRFHCMSIDIPMFLEGELRTVKYFEPDGIALRQTFDFPLVGDGIPVFPYPHPEQLTLPRFIKLQRVTNKGSVLPIPYYELTAEMCRLGLSSKDPVSVGDQSVVPYDFATAFLIRERDRILAETNFGEQRGCISVVVTGKKDGEPREFRLHMASASKALGEGTGIPAAIGTMLVHRGKASSAGVLPPEALLDATDFLGLVAQLPSLTSSASTFIEEVLPDGTVKQMPL